MVIPNKYSQMTAREAIGEIKKEVDENLQPGIAPNLRIYWDDWEYRGINNWSYILTNDEARAVDFSLQVRDAKQEMLWTSWLVFIDSLQLDASKNKLVMAVVCRYIETIMQAATKAPIILVEGPEKKPTKLCNVLKVGSNSLNTRRPAFIARFLFIFLACFQSFKIKFQALAEMLDKMESYGKMRTKAAEVTASDFFDRFNVEKGRFYPPNGLSRLLGENFYDRPDIAAAWQDLCMDYPQSLVTIVKLEMLNWGRVVDAGKRSPFSP